MSVPKQKPQVDTQEQAEQQPAVPPEGAGQPAAPITAEDVAEIFEEEAAEQQSEQQGDVDPAEVTLRKQREWGPSEADETVEPAPED